MSLRRGSSWASNTTFQQIKGSMGYLYFENAHQEVAKWTFRAHSMTLQFFPTLLRQTVVEFGAAGVPLHWPVPALSPGTTVRILNRLQAQCYLQRTSHPNPPPPAQNNVSKTERDTSPRCGLK
eukprot:4599502-Amphidinium_carterae.1